MTDRLENYSFVQLLVEGGMTSSQIQAYCLGFGLDHLEAATSAVSFSAKISQPALNAGAAEAPGHEIVLECLSSQNVDPQRVLEYLNRVHPGAAEGLRELLTQACEDSGGAEVATCARDHSAVQNNGAPNEEYFEVIEL